MTITLNIISEVFFEHTFCIILYQMLYIFIYLHNLKTHFILIQSTSIWSLIIHF